MCPLPVAADNLRYRIQPLSAARPYGKFQHQPLCVWTTGHLKPNASEQQTALAERQISVSSQFVHIEPDTLDIAELAFRIVPTRTTTAHDTRLRASLSDVPQASGYR
jgi:hypothetical protein